MKRKYRLSIDLTINVPEKVKGKGPKKSLACVQEILNYLYSNPDIFNEFIKCRFYWFHFENKELDGKKLRSQLKVLKYEEILMDIAENVPAETAHFIRELFLEGYASRKKDDLLAFNLGLFLDQFEKFQVSGAEFSAITQDNKEKKHRS